MSPVWRRDKPIWPMRNHERPGRALFFRQRGKLDGEFAHYVAVESDKVCDPQAVKNGKQQQGILRWLSERFRSLHEKTRPVHSGSGFGRRVAAKMEERSNEFDLELDFIAAHVGRAWQGRDHVERASELLRGFDQSRPLADRCPAFPQSAAAFSISPASAQ